MYGCISLLQLLHICNGFLGSMWVKENSMTSPTSENVELIKQMGLTDDEAIRTALRQTSNDVDAALQILLPDTDDQADVPAPGIESQSSFERINIDSYDIEMKV